MSAELLLEHGEPVTNPAEFATLSPEDQERHLLDTAVAAAQGDLESLSYAAELAPDGSPLVNHVYRRAASEHIHSPVRALVLARLSRREGALVAWDEGLLAARTLGEAACNKRPMLDYVYPLETLAAHQRDPQRLTTIVLHSILHSPQARAQVLRTVGVRQVAVGDIDGAMKSRDEIHKTGFHHRNADDVSLAIVEHQAQQDPEHLFPAWNAIKDVSPPRKVLGHIKIAKHAPATPGRWEETDKELAKHWDTYSTETQVGAIQDVLAAGEVERAAELAFRMPNAPYTSYWERVERRQAIFLASQQQATRDPGKAQNILARLYGETGDILNELIDQGLNWPTDTRAQFQNEMWQNELWATLNYTTIQQMAVTARNSPKQAIHNLERASFFEDDVPSVFRDEARVVIALAAAEEGHAEEAYQLLSSRSEHPLFMQEKSRAFTDLARVIRKRRLSQPGGQIALSALGESYGTSEQAA